MSINGLFDRSVSKVEITGAEARYLGDQGRIVGLDIGPEMLEQAWRRCQHLPVVGERLGNGGT